MIWSCCLPVAGVRTRAHGSRAEAAIPGEPVLAGPAIEDGLQAEVLADVQAVEGSVGGVEAGASGAGGRGLGVAKVGAERLHHEWPVHLRQVGRQAATLHDFMHLGNALVVVDLLACRATWIILNDGHR